jgi:cell division protease FtsH
MALGVTLSSPDADRVNYTRPELEAKIQVALGGRVADEVVFGTISTGAESDIQQLTQIARQMVGRWGMSDAIGPVSVVSPDGQQAVFPGLSESSPETQRLLDEEVRRLVEDSHKDVTELLEAHREQLESLTQALLAAETLDALDAYAAAGLPPHSAEPAVATAATAATAASKMSRS